MRFGVAILPPILVNNYASTVFSLIISAGAMLAVTAVRGWEPTREPRSLDPEGWLRASRAEAGAVAESAHTERMAAPVLLGLGVAVAGAVLSFVVFW